MKSAQFDSRFGPYLLLLPQMAVISIFFLWPAAEAVWASFFLEDPFFGTRVFVGLENYVTALTSDDYARAAWFTVIFTAVVTLATLGIGMWLAVAADNVLRGNNTYKTLLMWVYAIAPPVAGLIGVMLFDQHIGPLVDFVALFGHEMQVGVSWWDTAIAMMIVASWKQIPYTFIFVLSGLQSIPNSVREAAAIDCRSSIRRFWTVIFPLLAPTTFFLMIVNITYALFETFGIIDLMVKGEPGNNPKTLVYKVYLDGFRGNDLGGSSAQSVILMILVLALTIVQFRLIERRIHYS
ncbi:sn-glycerol 3-phosphate transport system permease protein [Albidovulum inexpectatum]|uniref:sn-glycerol-3-phosphate transport system permease protein UgpA n=1 Tax=Albidovulum inexpectatum TaxID=196587 RepID=A0A2S5JEM7_9RHOB|nr:ABC transporter permease subunit [Albidovulum inexpectatum]PPB79972.1 sn-glycerol 3-phosphate transport system permease protein [Albidovulum inexpectatum]